ncbi:MAG: NUDIX domain-containing protein [Desulfobacterales bacterium]
MRTRGTAVVIRDGKFLLVRDKGKERYSLPGGGSNRNEPSMAAAIRELYEELRMSAKKSERIFSCDFNGSLNRHKVSLIETDDEPRLQRKELDKFIWWDMKLEIPRYPHVDRILNNIKLYLQLG